MDQELAKAETLKRTNQAHRESQEAQREQFKLDFEAEKAKARTDLEEELKSARLELKQLNGEVENRKISYEHTQEAYNDKLNSLNDQTAEAQISINEKLSIIDKLTTDVSLLDDKIATKSRTITAQQEEEQRLSTVIPELTTQKTELESKVDEIMQNITLKQAELDNLESLYEDKKAKLERSVSSLTTKQGELIREIEATEQSRESETQRFLDWEKRLNSKDENIRVRERNVEESEGRIVRNSNLLNL